MSSYAPQGNGIKKPMNMLENPIYPDIRRAPPRFVWSKKHWKVDAGATLRDTESFSQFSEPAILAQSRSYNKTIYGQSSHKDIVNAEFRPPLQNYYEDIGPLNRVPATIEAIVPRINPGTAGHDGTSGYTAKNERPSDISSALTDRIKNAESHANFYHPMDAPLDNSILPDLEIKLPSISIHSGWNFPSQNTQERPELNLGDEKLQAVPIKSGYFSSVRIDGPNKFENYESRENRPQVSAHSGINTPYQMNSETPTLELFENRPQVSAHSGINTPYKMNSETPTLELFENRPQVSAHSGINTPYQMNSETPTLELFEKIDNIPINIINPGSSEGYRNQEPSSYDTDKYNRENIPSYSYSVPSQDPVFRSRNEETRPHFREKLQPIKSYGQVSHSGGHIPRFGIEDMYPGVLNSNPRSQRPNKYSIAKKKSVYRLH
jgi:hypothetical protein